MCCAFVFILGHTARFHPGDGSREKRPDLEIKVEAASAGGGEVTLPTPKQKRERKIFYLLCSSILVV